MITKIAFEIGKAILIVGGIRASEAMYHRYRANRKRIRNLENEAEISKNQIRMAILDRAKEVSELNDMDIDADVDFTKDGKVRIILDMAPKSA